MFVFNRQHIHVCSCMVMVVLSKELRCQPGRYYDDVTERCDSCDQLCAYVDMQNTRVACQQQCPGYLHLSSELTSTLPTRDDWIHAKGEDAVCNGAPCSVVRLQTSLLAVLSVLACVSMVTMVLLLTRKCKTSRELHCRYTFRCEESRPVLPPVNAMEPFQDIPLCKPPQSGHEQKNMEAVV